MSKTMHRTWMVTISLFVLTTLGTRCITIRGPSDSTLLPSTTNAELLQSKQKEIKYSEKMKSETHQHYGSFPESRKSHCNFNCSRNRRHMYKQSASTRMRNRSSRNKFFNPSKMDNNKTVNKIFFPKNTKEFSFSQKYSPERNSHDLGFVPVPGPYGMKRSSKKVQRQARNEQSKFPEELSGRESQTDEKILGNGHFEILRGGIFSDHDENEIVGNRRISRGFRTHTSSSFHQNPFRTIHNFHFPAVYRDRILNPMHPMYFPRGAFSQKQEIFE